jgi:hypothetical protein
VLASYVPALLGLVDHRGERGEIAQGRPDLVGGDAQREVAVAPVGARVERRAEHETAVTVGHRRHLVGDPVHVFARHVELQRERALDPALGLVRCEAAVGGEFEGAGRLVAAAPAAALAERLHAVGPARQCHGGDHDRCHRGRGQPRDQAGRGPRRPARPPHGVRLARKALLGADAQPLRECGIRLRGLGAQCQRQLLKLARERIGVRRGAVVERGVHRGQVAFHHGVSHRRPFAAW